MAFKGTARVGALDFKRESVILDTLDEGALWLAPKPVLNSTNAKRVRCVCRRYHRFVTSELSSVGSFTCTHQWLATCVL